MNHPEVPPTPPPATPLDERAFGRLYDEHTPYLYRLALRLTGGDAPLAEDCVHDAWIRAVTRWATFEGRSSLRTWLGGFVVNRVRESWRTPVDESLPEVLPADDPYLLAAADRVDLERAIAALPPGYRAVLVLHDVEGWTHEQIGERLGLAPGTSKSQLSRARDAMKARLTSLNETRHG